MGDAAPAGLAVRLVQRRGIPLDVTLACAPGETLALVGPSGSGKTTILRCIAGLRRAAEGRIDCAGETWFDAAAGVDVSPQRRAAGFVFQSYALFPHLSALDNVACALTHRPPAERATRARELLARVHLTGLEARKPAHLSGGQQQRVAVARALARDPKVLLLDEPSQGLAPLVVRELARIIRLLRDAGVTILLIEQNMKLAEVVADELHIMVKGRMVYSADPQRFRAEEESIRTRYLTL